MLDNLKKIRERLLIKKMDYDEEYWELENKTHFIKNNTLKEKLVTLGGFITLNYLFLVLSELGICKFLVPFLSESIIKILPIIVIGGSFILGFAEIALLNKKFNLKEKLKKVSKAKSWSEKLEELIEYNIKKEKIDNRRKICDKVLTNIDKRLENITALKQDYEVVLKDRENTFNREELQNLIDQELVKLDFLTERLVVKRDFVHYNDKPTRFMDKILKQMMAVVFSFLFVMMSVMPAAMVVSFQGLFNVMFFGPLIAGLVGSGIYNYIDSKMHNKAYGNLKEKYKLSDEETSINIEENLVKISDLMLKLEESSISEEVNLNKDKKISVGLQESLEEQREIPDKEISRVRRLY